MTQALGVLRDMLAPGSELEKVPWHRVRYEHVMAMSATLGENYAPASANKILAALRGVLRAAFGLRLMGADDLQRALGAKGVRGSRVPKGRAISKSELERLFELCASRSVGGARDAALLAILYGGGLRRSEVVGLDLADFDAREETLKIRGKGNKERVMYATNGARRALLAWLALRGDWPGPLFCPVTQSRTIVARRLSAQAVLDLVDRLGKRAGLAHMSPHDFRRTFVGDLLDAGADLATVQGLAGHASPTTTSRYDRRGDRARRRAAELLHVPFGPP
jgi:site-specific recombinase XerD